MILSIIMLLISCGNGGEKPAAGGEAPAGGEAKKEISGAEKMTTNAYITMIVQGYVNQNPVSTTAEVKALYQSNVQLVRIGNNLNQIAKALNLNQPTNITTELLNELKATINKHTEKVGNIITANIERLK